MPILRVAALFVVAFSIVGCGVMPSPGPSKELGWGGTSSSHRRPTVVAQRSTKRPAKVAQISTTASVPPALKPFSKEWYAAEAAKDRELKSKLITCRGC